MLRYLSFVILDKNRVCQAPIASRPARRQARGAAGLPLPRTPQESAGFARASGLAPHPSCTPYPGAAQAALRRNSGCGDWVRGCPVRPVADLGLVAVYGGLSICYVIMSCVLRFGESLARARSLLRSASRARVAGQQDIACFQCLIALSPVLYKDIQDRLATNSLMW